MLKIAAGLILCAAAALAQGNAESGKTLFNTKYRCYTCHGYDGHGGQGARLVPMKLPQAAFIAYVRNPRRMPPYGVKVVPDAELADIWAYVKTLPESPDVKNIPLLMSLMSQ
jgi:mono/diheme cytochrome c family protein